MRTNNILGIIGAILTVAAVAFAINTGGLGGNGPHSAAWCFIMYDTIMIMVLLWVVQCTVHCDPKDGRCTTICFRRMLIMWDIATVLLLVCLGTHMF